MNFFEHQDEAKHQTKRLVIYFFIALVFIIISLILVITTALDYSIYEQQFRESKQSNYFSYLFSQHGTTMLWVSLGTVALVGGISLVRTLTLREGGHVVAEWVGARQVSYDTQDHKEQQLLNIVDEMSIASGAPRPGVYLMDDEMGINAFAAGYSSSNAVIAVTRGTLEQLSRDELQGVIAHEFSHILNGDMRLNIRLMGVLAGILFIGNIGLLMIRSIAFTRRRSRGNNGIFGIIAIGLAVAAIGFIGVFCGRLIRAAVSRQREYLADASAVQFTRNPDGITNALNKIRLISSSSKIENKHAEEMSHMYFGEAFPLVFFSGWLASHPPLPDRITRINPQFDLEAELNELDKLDSSQKKSSKNKSTKSKASKNAALSGLYSGFSANAGESIVETTGTISNEQVEYGKSIHSLFSANIMLCLQSETGLRALLYALMLDQRSGFRQRQLELINASGETSVASKAAALYHEVTELEPKTKLPLFNLLLPELRRQIQATLTQNENKMTNARNSGMTDAACIAILDTIEKIITIDEHISIKEFIYLLAIDANLNPKANQAIKTKYTKLKKIPKQTAMLIALMSIAGHEDPAMQKQAYNAGIKAAELGSNSSIQLDSFSYAECRNAMYEIKKLKPQAKKMMMRALAETALSDETITLEEFDLLRSLAMALDCPIPPNVGL